MDMDELAQGLRRAHCSNQERDHECVGTCTITVKGIDLDCKLCGKDDRPIVLRASWRRESERAKDVLAVAGLDFDKLAPLVQRAVIAELMKDCCPGCGAHMAINAQYATCVCGDYAYHQSRWHKSAAHLERLRAEKLEAARPGF